MDGYTFQTHAVYRDRKSGGCVLLVHHNPMALRSLLLQQTENGFDWTAPVPVGVDTIIEMRRSGSFEEHGGRAVCRGIARTEMTRRVVPDCGITVRFPE